MKIKIILFHLILLLACEKKITENKEVFKPNIHDYQEMKAHSFFEKIVSNHQNNFHKIDSLDANNVFNEFKLSTNDSTNYKKFYSIKILHKLFTSKNAKNGSKGDILNVPYFWHWISPNPRYEIIELSTNKKLSKIKTSKEFNKYKSHADIDRTPFLFINEMLSEKDLYKIDYCGNFSTFGWCSEREMAFVCLLKTLNFEGKVITKSNHSWSEFIIPMNNIKNEIVNFNVKVDNTFDLIKWEVVSDEEIKIWKDKKFQSQGNWYNQKALSETEKQLIKNLNVSTITSKKIEEKIILYLKEFQN